MPIEGITTPDVVVHLENGRMQLSIDWVDSRPATASVVYRCPWASAIALARELRGGFPPEAAGGNLVAPLAPHAFPLIPELYCHGVGIRPKGDEVVKQDQADAFSCHVHALVTAQYKSPEWAFDAAQAAAYPATQIDPGNPIVGCKQRVRVSTSFLTFEGAKLKFQTSGKVIESTDGIPANQVEFVLEYPRLYANPTLFLNQFKGKVNSVALFGLDPEHVLFDAFEVDTTTSLGTVECSAVLTFRGSIDVTWNERLNDEGDPEAVKFINSSPAKKPFTSTDLRAIF